MNKLFSKIVSAVTAAAMMLFVSSGSLQTFVNEIDAHAAETDVILGDVNDDDRVDVFDLCLIKQELSSSGSASINKVAADVNADGVVDVKDAIEVQDFLLCRTKGFTGNVKKSISSLDRSVTTKSVSSKDMPDYCDIQVTGDIAELAEKLQSIEAIYEYVANTVNAEFYIGLRKGAIGTFEQNGGNDYDQASLLLAMLTYMDYDASYAAVNASLTATDLMALTYTENIEAAIKVYTAQGKSLTKQSDGTYVTERVGVIIKHDDETLFLDPAFKKYEKNPNAINLVDLSDDIDTKYLNNTQIDEYTAVLKAESAYNNQSMADAFPQYQIISQKYAAPSYKIIGNSETALSELDNIELYVGNKKAFSLPSAYLYNKNLTIEYEFVTYNDEDVQEFNKMFLDSLGLNSVDDLTKNLGTYEKQVMIYAVVKLDGKKIAVGAPGNLGDKEQLQIKITSNGKDAVFDKELTYGALYSVIFDSQIISPYEIADLYSKLPQTIDEQKKLNSGNIYGSETMMNTLSLIGKTYFSQVDTNNTVLANMTNSYYSHDLSVAVVDYTPEIRTDNYVRLTGNGKIGIDVIGNRPLFNSRSNNSEDESKLRHSAGYLSSYLEGEVLEQMTGIRSVSTAEVFSQAAEQNIEIHHISKGNLNELNSCKMSAANKTDITDYANQGMIITVPNDEVSMDSWTGTGYIVYDPQTDNTLYIINNNLNGGSLCSWVTLSYICDLAIFFAECTWAFDIIMFSIALFCAVPFLAGGAAVIVALLGVTTFVIGAKFTISIGENLRDDTLLYMQYRDGDTAAGERLKRSALKHALFAGAVVGIGKVAGGAFSKALNGERFGPALQKIGNSIGSYFTDAFAGTPGGFEGAIRLINRVSPSSGKAIAGFIGKFGNGFAKSLGNAYYSGGIKDVDNLLKFMEKYGDTANRDFLSTTLQGADFGKALDTYEALDDIAGKYSEDAMHYDFADGEYRPDYKLSDIDRIDQLGNQMYEEFRMTNDDIVEISNNTGWSVEDVTTVKNHVFNDVVLKDDGVYGTLDSYYEQALAWQRLIDGNYFKSDVLLLEHELFEATYYNHFHSINGCTLRDAHEFTTNYYDWDGLITEILEKYLS